MGVLLLAGNPIGGSRVYTAESSTPAASTPSTSTATGAATETKAAEESRSGKDPAKVSSDGKTSEDKAANNSSKASGDGKQSEGKAASGSGTSGSGSSSGSSSDLNSLFQELSGTDTGSLSSSGRSGSRSAATTAKTPAWAPVVANKKDLISLDFRGAEIDNVLWIYSKACGVTITKDPALKGPVTMISDKKISLNSAFYILEAELNSRGYSLSYSKDGPVLRVVKSGSQPSERTPSAREMPRPPETPRSSTNVRIFQLKYADAQALVRILGDLFGQRGGPGQTGRGPGAGPPGSPGNPPQGNQPGGGGPAGVPSGGPFGSRQESDVRFSADPYSNSVIANANSTALTQIEELINSLDKPVSTPMQMKVIELQYANAQEVATVVSGALQSSGGRQGGGGASLLPFERRVTGGSSGSYYASLGQVMPFDRTNSLVVTGTPETIQQVVDLVKELDKPVETEPTTRTLYLAHAQATEMAALLNQVLRGGTTSNTLGYTINYNYNTNRRSNTRTSNFGSSRTANRAAPLPGAASYVDGETAIAPPPPTDEAVLPEETDDSRDSGGPTRQYSPWSRYNYSSQRPTTSRNAQGRRVSLLDLPSDVIIVADPNTNALVINNIMPDDFTALQALIQELDVVPEQVLIEAIIAEATLDASSKLGVEWTWTTSDFLGTGAGATANANFPHADLAQAPFFRFSVVGKSVQAALSALVSDKRFRVLSTPRIFTTNHKQAQINIVERIPYVESVTQTDNTRISDVAYEEAGIILDVMPHITKDDYVSVEVQQEASEFRGFTSFNAPLIGQRQANTTITVKNGETIILGGIIRDSKDRSNYKVPLLGDIPLLGQLFRTKTNTNSKTELLVFLTPRIVRDAAQAAALTGDQKAEINIEIPPLGTQPSPPAAALGPQSPTRIPDAKVPEGSTKEESARPDTTSGSGGEQPAVEGKPDETSMPSADTGNQEKAAESPQTADENL